LKNKSNWFKLWNEDEKVGLKIENDTDEGYIKIKGIFIMVAGNYELLPLHSILGITRNLLV
jgi:hypothetical protein